MKTKSITSTIALLGLAFILTGDVLAGPGPQTYVPRRSPSEPKKVTVAQNHGQKSLGMEKETARSTGGLIPVLERRRAIYCYRQ